MAKMFDTSCPVSSFIPVSSISDPGNVELWCKVNGEARQSGNTKDMIFSVPTLISFISDYFTLEEGDLVLTGLNKAETLLYLDLYNCHIAGTPSGVGPVQEGDVITGGIPGVIDISFDVTRRL